jgi:CopG family nickel-responsive transcriptional regulator
MVKYINILLISISMTIISVSLNDKNIEEINRIQKEHGYSGRSEIIRAGLRLLISESKNSEKIFGEIKSILILIHNHDDEGVVSDIKHKFKGVIQTQIHSHFKEDKCLEIFVLEGNAENIKEMVRLLQTSKKMDLIKFLVT